MSEDARAPGAPAPLGLNCLGGGAAPPEILDDVRRVLGLPAPVKERLWEALVPSLPEPVPPAVEGYIQRFCRALHVDEAELGRAVKACRFLIRKASAIDLGEALFAEDLLALGAGSTELWELLLPRYEAAKKLLRAEIARGSLLDHGKVLEGVDWRIDVATSSSRGSKFRLPIVVLTLRYRDGDRSERLTLQVAPDALPSMRDFFEQILK